MIPPPPSLVKQTIESPPGGGFILSGVEREVDFVLFFAKDGKGGPSRRGSGGFEAGRGCILIRSRDGGHVCVRVCVYIYI